MESKRSNVADQRAKLARTNVILKKYKNATAKRLENVKLYMDPTDISTWYGLLHNFSGNADEYKGGEYLVRVVLTAEFPYKPPEFYMMTPNGLFECECKVCIHIGEFHPEDYTPAMPVELFFENLMNGMIVWHDMKGIGIFKSTIDKKKDLAKKSIEYNRDNCQAIIDKINEAEIENTIRWNAELAKTNLAVASLTDKMASNTL